MAPDPTPRTALARCPAAEASASAPAIGRARDCGRFRSVRGCPPVGRGLRSRHWPRCSLRHSKITPGALSHPATCLARCFVIASTLSRARSSPISRQEQPFVPRHFSGSCDSKVALTGRQTSLLRGEFALGGDGSLDCSGDVGGVGRRGGRGEREDDDDDDDRGWLPNCSIFSPFPRFTGRSLHPSARPFAGWSVALAAIPTYTIPR